PFLARTVTVQWSGMRPCSSCWLASRRRSCSPSFRRATFRPRNVRKTVRKLVRKKTESRKRKGRSRAAWKLDEFARPGNEKLVRRPSKFNGQIVPVIGGSRKPCPSNRGGSGRKKHAPQPGLSSPPLIPGISESLGRAISSTL